MGIFSSLAGPVMVGQNYAFTIDETEMIHEGHLADGSVSGQTSLSYLIALQHALTTEAREDGTMTLVEMELYQMNGTLGGGAGNDVGGRERGAARLSDGTVLSQDIYSHATNAEVCLVFLNVFSGKSAGRTKLRRTDQDTLVTSMLAECNNTVITISIVDARLVDTYYHKIEINYLQPSNIPALSGHSISTSHTINTSKTLINKQCIIITSLFLLL
ncbi:putative beta-glucosidase d protein [Botrytis fragariae]|uniref:beta-glucosidase n=1 Tax=Botrytis fragariae TaxID=1964551 RepID=A0A8H6AS68_9HELO|nr:putative beta-glucosidase d protein [Botrytis fragariae]KAF5872440.1 putative beta-glucosidase d protein [Botrytis fragariae]